VKRIFNKFPEISGKIGINFRKFSELTTLTVTDWSPGDSEIVQYYIHNTFRQPAVAQWLELLHRTKLSRYGSEVQGWEYLAQGYLLCSSTQNGFQFNHQSHILLLHHYTTYQTVWFISCNCQHSHFFPLIFYKSHQVFQAHSQDFTLEGAQKQRGCTFFSKSWQPFFSHRPQEQTWGPQNTSGRENSISCMNKSGPTSQQSQFFPYKIHSINDSGRGQWPPGTPWLCPWSVWISCKLPQQRLDFRLSQSHICVFNSCNHYSDSLCLFNQRQHTHNH